MNTTGASYNGLVAGDNLSVSATGLFSDKNVGVGKSVALTNSYSGTDLGNYTITDQTGTTADITPKGLTISGITADNKVYDGTTSATVNTTGVNYSGIVSGDNLSVSATGLFSDKNVGVGKSVALTTSYSGSDLGNYTITDQATTTADITPRSVTVSGITADNKVYDGNTLATVNTGGASYSGILSGDDLSVSPTVTKSVLRAPEAHKII